MLGGYEAEPLQYDPGALPARFDIADLELDLGVLRRLADSVREQLPVFQQVPETIKLRVHRGGLPTMTADGEHTVVRYPEFKGSMWPVGVASAACLFLRRSARCWPRGSPKEHRHWTCPQWRQGARAR